MTNNEITCRLSDRLEHAAVHVRSDVLDGLVEYVVILARWNARINLTAFDVDRLTDAAIDRLIVEPVRAADQIAESERAVWDLGSGGGSPAIPLKLCAPWLGIRLVESRIRKCAFLREAGRCLGLKDFDVTCDRFEVVAKEAIAHASIDVLTMRAVKTDETLWASVRRVLKPSGRVFWFSDSTIVGTDVPVGFAQFRQVSDSPVIVFTRTQ